MKVLVAGWIGSTNLGDELVFAGVRHLLAEADIEVAAISLDPAATRRIHGVGAVGANDLIGINHAIGRVDALVFGGGGLLQDVTSPLNLPYHLSRVVLARLRRTPVAGFGLGVGGLDTRLGHALTKATMRGVTALSVRDQASARLLTDVGVPGAIVAADPAFALPIPEVAVTDRLVVALRPWGGGSSRLPAAARGDATPEAQVAALAAALDDAVERTGLQVRFVALQADRDDPFHRRVAARMAHVAEFVCPDLDGLTAEFAAARAVISMRYHGGVAAVLGGRPVVLVSYALKVDALARELGAAGRLLEFTPGALAGLGDALEHVMAHEPGFAVTRDRLRERQDGNRGVIAALHRAARSNPPEAGQPASYP